MFLSSCSLEKIDDLNGPALDTILTNSNRGDIQDLVGGILNDMRIRLGTYLDNVGVVGRDFYRFSSSDPRLTGDLLGKGESILDNNTFYITGPWAGRYGTVKSANILMEASKNTTPAYSAEELNAINGFAKTIQAYELLLNLNLTQTIRVDVKNPKELGPFLDYDSALVALGDLLDEAATDLENAGDEFPFKLSDGFENFDKPDSFREFNRAIAARVDLYAGDKAGALSALSESFLDVTDGAAFNKGIFYNYSTNGADILNPMFFPLNASTAGARIAHPTFVTDAEYKISGTDTIYDSRRTSKAIYRMLEDGSPNPLTLDELTGNYDFFVFKSNVDNIPMIRNEELILIYAEANLGTNQAEADKAVNILRAAAGLDDKTGVTIDDILYERRYSLYGEGHRWVDMRRLGKLADLPIDRVDDDVWEKFPVPATENQ